MREVEIKLRVNDLDALEKKLTEAGLEISKEVTQDDVVYVPKDASDPFSNVKVGDAFVRIRKQNGINTLTLKQQRGVGLDKTEHETKIDNSEEVHQMLLIMGWKPAVQVVKKRKKGKMGEYEICLDKVEQLGGFVELEKMTDDNADPIKIKKELFEALKSYGLSEKDEETKGYDILIYNLKSK